MKRLILMRHAKTEPWIDGIDDHGRALISRGHEAAKRIAEAIAEEGWQPDHAIVSTARRTRETWGHFSSVHSACHVSFDEGLYLAGERRILELVTDADNASTLLVIGHNPGMHDAALGLMRMAGSLDHQSALRLSTKMPTGAAALYEAEEDGVFNPAQFRLYRFIRPKDLIL